MEWGVGRLLAPVTLFLGRIQVRGWKSQQLEPEQAAGEPGVLFNLASWLFHAAAITCGKLAWGAGEREGR